MIKLRDIVINDWRPIKRRILKRDKEKCVVCGSKQELILHHVKPILDINGNKNFIHKNPKIWRVIQILRDIYRRSGSLREKLINELKKIEKSISKEEYCIVQKIWDKVNSEMNLVILCKFCHKEVHSYSVDEKEFYIDEKVKKRKKFIQTRIFAYLNSLDRYPQIKF